jgi:hypothetical protein
MNDQDASQVVTLVEAVNQVKKWFEEKNYDQAIEGCKEILQIEPENKEIKDLLEKANNALKPQPTAVATAPILTPAAPVAKPAAAPAPVVAPAPAVTPAAAPKAVPAQASPSDIFNKPVAVKAKVDEKKPEMPVKKASAPAKEKSGMLGTVVTIVIFLALLGGFVYSFLQGWLNPFYDWILGLFGL